MKKLIVLSLLLNTFVAFAQDHLVEIVLDGKPAILNTKTGETRYTNGKPNTTTNYSTSENNSEIVNTHTVVRGETLYSISKKYGVSMAQIKSVNNLEDNTLSIGQSLKIGYDASSQVSNGDSWIVKKGDTLYAISRKTGVSVATIKTLNNLESNIISIGQNLALK
ncbi:LysM peptidoglycan-binding domain-containing protein [Olleya sp. R77988]|uniref:LysM peptidoglycan-binding domain-containing protein n=1 Tax=Olleya sp. R77988 TaxID=3093875 RepID=UPI0037C66B43